MYSFFYGTFTCASMNYMYLDRARRSAHFTRALGVSLTNTEDSTIAHTHYGRNETEGRKGRGKPDRMSQKYKKKCWK